MTNTSRPITIIKSCRLAANSNPISFLPTQPVVVAVAVVAWLLVWPLLAGRARRVSLAAAALPVPMAQAVAAVVALAVPVVALVARAAAPVAALAAALAAPVVVARAVALAVLVAEQVVAAARVVAAAVLARRVVAWARATLAVSTLAQLAVA